MSNRMDANNSQYKQPGIWGGIECTIVRIKDAYFDQLNYNGHYQREEDIAALAATGIKKLRYPVLWERHQPVPNQPIDWTWVENRLNLIRSYGIDPIAGLVHHGSGPAHTNLTDPKFPELVAAYAYEVAKKFPWLEYYTPVNEPLTTARFSGLYGVWYPHSKDDHSFLTMLVHQVKAVVLSMKAIRQINPDAKLVQTEDLGKTYSTPLLKYQADFENERRWLSLDLLCGKVDKDHQLWNYLMKFNVNEDDLIFLQQNPCPPDVMGFNHYLTSERYLDEDMKKYRLDTHGGNYKHKYADIEAVRIELKEPSGIKVLLKEAAERYKLPIAITEAHLHCSREDQLRWFRYVYNACDELSQEGFQVVAVTAWSMLGAFGWNKLLTACPGEYEPGVFDVRTGKPRPTALAKYLADLTGSPFNKRLIESQPGWWQRDSRYIFPGSSSPVISLNTSSSIQPVVIIGKNGTLGKAFSRICAERHISHHLLSRQECDISNRGSIEAAIAKYNPWAIINAAGYVKVDEAETDCDSCYNANTAGAENLAKACEAAGVKLVTFSSDLVFDGKKGSPYTESNSVNPLNVYGKSKANAESVVSGLNPTALIIRSSAFFDTLDEYNFAYFAIKLLSEQQQFTVAENVHISPTYVPDLVNATLDILIDDESGIWHLANVGETTWADFAFEIADRAQLDTRYINVLSPKEMNWAAPRPLYSVLSTEKGYILPTLENALDRFFKYPTLYAKLHKAQQVSQTRS
jgi:dTDP-4-dehydrorhamnose reductase